MVNPNPGAYQAGVYENRVHPHQGAHLEDLAEAQRQRMQRLIGSILESHQKMEEPIQAIEICREDIVDKQQKVRQTIEKLEDPAIQEKFTHIEELQKETKNLQKNIQVQQIVAQEALYDIQQEKDAIQKNLQQLANKKGVFEEIHDSVQKVTTTVTNLAKEGLIALHGVTHQSIHWFINIPESIQQKLSHYTWSVIENAFLHPISLIAIAILLYLVPVAGAILGSVVIYILAKKIYDFILPHLLLILQKQ